MEDISCNAENKITKNILIGCTGSVATMKLPLLVEELLKYSESRTDLKLNIRVVVTERARHFFALTEIPLGVDIFGDELEWSSWKVRGDPVLHIDLTKWADIMCIAPLDANTLAKVAQGLCDNLLTCTTRAWDTKKPLLFCPAMNTKMWEHPATSPHIQILQSWGHTMVPPISKTLICGDTGNGAMAEVGTVVAQILLALKVEN